MSRIIRVFDQLGDYLFLQDFLDVINLVSMEESHLSQFSLEIL